MDCLRARWWTRRRAPGIPRVLSVLRQPCGHHRQRHCQHRVVGRSQLGRARRRLYISVTPQDATVSNQLHVDVHRSPSTDPRDGRLEQHGARPGGDGGPGVGVMHLDYQDILDARLRNPLPDLARAAGAEMRSMRRASTPAGTGGKWRSRRRHIVAASTARCRARARRDCSNLRQRQRLTPGAGPLRRPKTR